MCLCYALCFPRFGEHGASPHRLDRLGRLGSCRCHRRICFQNIIDMKDSLMQFLKLFWAMAKHVQDEYLKTVIMGGNVENHKSWFFFNTRFGPKCCLAILGVGNSRWARIGKGRLDRRFAVWGGVPCLTFELFCFVLSFSFIGLEIIIQENKTKSYLLISGPTLVN